jgi:hypothetical protein
MSESESSISMTYIQLTHDELPVQRIYEIDGVNYILNFDYNEVGDFYTFTILDEEESPLYAGKLAYLRNALQEVVPGLSLKNKLLALNLSDALREIPAIERISIDNFDGMRICII